MLSPVTLCGRFVCLEPLSIDHAQALSEAASEDRSTYRFTPVPDALAETEHYIDLALTDYKRGRALPFAVRHLETDRIVGATSFFDLDVFPSRLGGTSGSSPTDEIPPTVAEIGATWFASSVQRTGVNTECKLLMLSYAFDTWKTVRVTLKTDARNTRSRTAILRLGAAFEGIRSAHSPASDGGIRDTAFF